MQFFEVKDIVREHLSRTTFPTEMLDQALRQGRRFVEQQGNWYWMSQEAFFASQINLRTYPLFTALTGQAPMIQVTDFSPSTPTNTGPTGAPIVPSTFSVPSIPVPGFKDARFMLVKTLTDVEWSPMEFGGVTKEECDLHFSITEVGEPEIGILDNFTIHLYPSPDKSYFHRFYYYGWTGNPAGNLLTDELCSRFPDALIYAALSWAYEMELKDFQGAQYWRQLLGIRDVNGQPVIVGGELAKIKRHNYLREQQDKISLIPMTGPYQRVRRLRLTQNIWLGSGGSL